MSDENPTIHRSLSSNPQADLAGDDPHFEPSAERYRVIEEIARGGMGRILKVYDNDLRRYVAMKVVRAPEGLDTYQIHKFVEEAQISAQLQHPGIVPTYEVGTDGDGNLYYTMKLVEGRSLSQIMRAIKDGAETMSELKRLQTLQSVTQALGYAHAKGVVHRDLKPDNIMLGRHGEVLVIDWGLARVMGRTPSSTGSIVTTKRSETDSTQTMDGTIAGTPVYMAPEQAEGRMDDIEPRTDVYALGAILFHLLTLQQPVVGRELRELLDNVARGKLREVPRNVPRELAAVIRRATALEPKDRYPTAEAFAEDLQAYIEGRRGEAWSDNPLTLAVKWVRRNRAPAAVGVAAVLTILALVAVQQTRPGTLDLDSNPIGAEVRIDGEPAGTTPLRGHRIGAGEHEVVLRLADHLDATQRVHVDAGSRADYVFNLRPVFGVLSLTSDPIGAEVVVGGQSRGRTPFTMPLPAGSHAIEMTMRGHLPLREEVHIADGGAVTRRHVELVRNIGRLRIPFEQIGVVATVRPADGGDAVARVTLPHPDALELEPGRYRLDLALDDHAPWSGEFDIERDGETRAGAWLPPWTLWTVDLGAGVTSAPAMSDLDQDGILDAVVTLQDGNVAAVSGFDGTILWKKQVTRTGFSFTARTALSDADGDGIEDCFLALGARLLVLSGKSGEELWNTRVSPSYGVPLSADLDGDGTDDAVLCAMAGVQALSGRDGRTLWETPIPAPGLSHTGAVLADFNADGVADCASLTAKGAPIVLSGLDGTLLWNRDTETATYTALMGAADLDADGKPDLVVSEAPETLIAYSGEDGRILWRRTGAFRNVVEAAFADFDGDGAADVATAAYGPVRVLCGRNGDTIWEGSYGSSSLHVSLGRLDDDDIPDLIVTGTLNRISAYSGTDGRPIWAVETNEPNATAPSLTDLDGDGRLDVIYGMPGGRLVACSPAAGRVRWSVRSLNIRTIVDAGDAVIVLNDPAVVEARSSRDGSLLWSSAPWTILAESSIDGALFVASDTRLAALSSHDGTPRWSVEIDAGPDQILVPGNGTIVVAGQRIRDGGVEFSYAVHATADGRPLRQGATAVPMPDAPTLRPPFSAAAADFDGDGVADLAVLVGTDLLRMLSGADGSTRWEAPIEPAGAVSVMRIDDLDSDGAPDVLVHDSLAILAFAGRDGRLLWKTASVLVMASDPATGDVDGDGHPDVIGGGFRAFCASGLDGERLWLYPRRGGMLGQLYGTPALLNRDAFFPAPEKQVCAVSAVDGIERWRTKLNDGDATQVKRSGDRIIVATTGTLTAIRTDATRNRWVWHGGTGRDFSGARADRYDARAAVSRAEAAYDGRRNASLLARCDAIENLAGDPEVRRRAALLAAKLAARDREDAAAITWLERAAGHGFRDTAALEADEAFGRTRSLRRFQALIERMRGE